MSDPVVTECLATCPRMVYSAPHYHVVKDGKVVWAGNVGHPVRLSRPPDEALARPGDRLSINATSLWGKRFEVVAVVDDGPLASQRRVDVREI